jgi:hypothetical protein
MPHSIPHERIAGWGADLDKSKRPAVPKEHRPPRNVNVSWTEPEYQEQSVRVYHSIERPRMTPVFGSPCPPKGLSGKIRELAFRYSESNTNHWLLLLFADRINVIEGLFEDLSKGFVPNIFAEMGWAAKLKYNKKGTLKMIGVIAGVCATFALLSSKRTRTEPTAD